MTRFACACLLILCCGLSAAADDPFYTLEPRPQSPALPEPEARDPETPAVAEKPTAENRPRADDRPKIRFCTELNCDPCRWRKQEILDGALDAFQVEILRKEKDECPAYVRWFPCFIFEDANGQEWTLPKQDGPEFVSPPVPTIAQVIDAWKRHNPGRALEPVKMQSKPVPASAGKSIADQVKTYLGPEGRITIEPRTPIVAVMEDGTKVSYSRIIGEWRLVNGQPQIVFSPPLPRVDARKFFLHFGATINDATFEPPDAVRVGTSAGKYRIKLELDQ